MKQIKDKLFLPKFLRDILNVVYWFSIIGVGLYLLLLSWAYISGNTSFGNMLLTASYSFPIPLHISEAGELMINNSLYEVSITKCKGILLVLDPPFALLVFTNTIVFLGTTIFLYVINLLRKILKNISDGKQFNNQNGIYIRNIGLIVIVSSIVKIIFEMFLMRYLSANITFENLRVNFTINLELGVVFLGFVILVISQIFRLGTEIKNDQELTI